MQKIAIFWRVFFVYFNFYAYLCAVMRETGTCWLPDASATCYCNLKT